MFREQIRNRNGNNNNILIFGDSGSGRISLIKEEIEKYSKDSNQKLYILDLSGEYIDTVRKLNGKVINMSLDNFSNRVNPIYLGKKTSDCGKRNTVNALVEQISLKNKNCYSYVNNIIEECALVYNKEFDLEELYNYVLSEANSEYHEQVVNTLELFTSMWGGYFNTKNTIDLQNISENIIAFDMSNLNIEGIYKSIITESLLQLISEDINKTEGNSSSRVLIANLELLDSSNDVLLERLSRVMRMRNSGLIISTYSLDRITGNVGVKNYSLINVGYLLLLRTKPSNLDIFAEYFLFEKEKLCDIVSSLRPKEYCIL